MKLATRIASNKQLDDAISSEKFEIVQNAKMFGFLSDKIYSNPLLAIVRELSTNARDSQVSNKNEDVPFHVHLPTRNTPTFYIRDFGTGMSEQTISDVYRKYGSSTKDTSNDFTGCLGLGSKTPFCYHTKSFTIDNWYGGVHTIYRCYIGDDGTPACDKLLEEFSSEPTGLKVSVSIKLSDIETVKQYARDVYAHFPVKPINKSDTLYSKETFPSPIYISSYKNCKIRANGNPRVIMGCVAYNLDTDKINQHYIAGLDIYVSTGEVSFTIGREELQYDKKTVAVLSKYIDDFIEECVKDIQAKIDSCKNYHEACVLAAQLKLPYKTNTTNFKYNGIHIETGYKYITVAGVKRRVGFRRDISSNTQDRFYWSYSNKVTVFEIPKSVTPHDFRKRWDELRKTSPGDIHFLEFDDAKAKKDFCDAVGIDESYIGDYNSLPLPPKKPRSKTPETEYYERDARYTSRWVRSTTPFDIKTIGSNAMYVEFFRGKPVGISASSLGAKIVELAKYITIPTIVGIKTADIDRVKKLGLKNFIEFMGEQEKILYDKFIINDCYYVMDNLTTEEHYISNMLISQFNSSLPMGLRDDIKLVIDVINSNKSQMNYNSFFNTFGYYIPKYKPSQNVKDAMTNIKNSNLGVKLRSLYYSCALLPFSQIERKCFESLIKESL